MKQWQWLAGLGGIGLLGLGIAMAITNPQADAFDDFAEHAMAVIAGVVTVVVQMLVAFQVDEELRGGGVWVSIMRHGEGAWLVGKAVLGFVRNGACGWLAPIQGLIEGAALHHETFDDAVKYRAIIEAGFDIVEEIFHGLRGFVRIQFHNNVAGIGLHFHPGIAGAGCAGG